MKIREYLIEETTSGNVGTYDVPFADKKQGYHRTDIPLKKRNKKNIPKGINIKDWLKIDRQ